MVVFEDNAGHLVLATKRTKTKVHIIIYARGKRCKRQVDAVEFRRLYTMSAVNPEFLANTWLNSKLKMTQEVRKELEMFIEVNRGKIVAKHEEMPETPNEKSKFYGGTDDVVVLKAPDMTKLNSIAGGEAFTSTDKAINAQATWDAMIAYEIPAKVEKPAKEKKERAEGGPRKSMPANGTITVLKPEHGKKGYRKVIYDIICESATIEELKGKTYEQAGKTCKIPAADVFDAIALGIISVEPITEG